MAKRSARKFTEDQLQHRLPISKLKIEVGKLKHGSFVSIVSRDKSTNEKIEIYIQEKNLRILFLKAVEAFRVRRLEIMKTAA